MIKKMRKNYFIIDTDADHDEKILVMNFQNLSIILQAALECM